ncbi:hypothetical protein CHS0354_021876 [Potamilus streckersoni]|uniref:Uncharacterized protein n=1 Tax=Potamilus streckersoni TaxID=2493646 RepID=A0AAE0TJY1_9BIVA|nr:hypothetical protein CHS0354_021876 [Potamilus streckersoni]
MQQPDEEISDTSRRPLVIAIDFGTTYSGYAYQFIEDYKTHPIKISTPQPFNGGKRNLASMKTPTCILINDKSEVDSFGYEAEDRYEEICIDEKQDKFYFFKQFKMKLQDLEGLQPSFPLLDETGNKSMPANVVFSLAIKSLKNHALDTVRKERTSIKEDDVLWVLTVPAIWDEKAVAFMKSSAVLAGIEKTNLMIAFEPEAAAFACKYISLTTMSGETNSKSFSDIDPGSYYMVVDLGGGTADVVIHKKLGGNKVKEVLRPSGGPWGGTAVDSKFIQFIIKIAGAPVFKKFQEKSHIDYIDFLREFEAKKRNFHQDAKTKVYLRISGDLSCICKEETGKDFKEAIQETKYASKVKFIGDKAVFDPEIFDEFFSGVSDEIINHIKNLIATPEGSKVSIILLVGGFTQSPYIQNAIKKKFEQKEKHVLIPNEPEISVLKGAIIFARQSVLMAPRIREGIVMASLGIGMDISSLCVQFKHKYLEDPSACMLVRAPGEILTKMGSKPCLLIGTSNEVYGTGLKAQKKFEELCSEGLDQTWHFFQNIYPQQSRQVTIEDHRGISMKVVDVLSMYIKHEWQYLWTSITGTSNDGFIRRNEVSTVIAVPIAYLEDAEDIIISAAKMAGISEEMVCLVSEQEAIYKYVSISRKYSYGDRFSVSPGSKICIANLRGSSEDLTFHKIQGQSLSIPYKKVSGPWGSKYIVDGFLDILAEIVGTNVVDRFKKQTSAEYEEFVQSMTQCVTSYSSRDHAKRQLRLKMSHGLIEFCQMEHSLSLNEILQKSPYSSQIRVTTDKIQFRGSILDRYFQESARMITEHVKENLVQGCGGLKPLMILTGEFADFEEIKNTLLSNLSSLGVQTTLISSYEAPILKGANIFGWVR